MSHGSFDHVQLSAIEAAAERVAQTLGAEKDGDKLIVSRAVFDIAAETNVFDPDRLAEMARERLTPNLGWRFSKSTRSAETSASDVLKKTGGPGGT